MCSSCTVSKIWKLQVIFILLLKGCSLFLRLINCLCLRLSFQFFFFFLFLPLVRIIGPYLIRRWIMIPYVIALFYPLRNDFSSRAQSLEPWIGWRNASARGSTWVSCQDLWVHLPAAGSQRSLFYWGIKWSKNINVTLYSLSFLVLYLFLASLYITALLGYHVSCKGLNFSYLVLE